MLLAPAAMAYQVTGPVLEVTDSTIVVEKDKEKWEIARDKSTKVSGDVKKGDKVTVQYRMTATSIEVKDAKAPAKKK
jgi:RNase P/RNase MRP subunit p29